MKFVLKNIHSHNSPHPQPLGYLFYLFTLVTFNFCCSVKIINSLVIRKHIFGVHCSSVLTGNDCHVHCATPCWAFCHSILLTSPINKAKEFPSASFCRSTLPFLWADISRMKNRGPANVQRTSPRCHVLRWVTKSIKFHFTNKTNSYNMR